MRAYARGALLGARGNSGVILSQLVGALLRRIGEAGPEDRSAAVFADGMALATDAAYAAVGKPVEGTILSVARAASEAAAEAAEDPGGAARRRGPRRGRRPPARRWRGRPTSCRCWPQAGVVDAGGRGLCVVLDAAESAITGQRATTATAPVGPVGASRSPRVPTGDLTEDGPAYEVMYLLETDDDAIPALREDLGAARRLAGRRGRRGPLERARPRRRRRVRRSRPASGPAPPRRIQVTHFAEQVARAREQALASGAAASSSSWRPGPGWSSSSASAGAAGDRGRTRPPAEHRRRSSRRSRPPARRRSSCCPTTPTRSASPRPRRTRPS